MYSIWGILYKNLEKKQFNKGYFHCSTHLDRHCRLDILLPDRHYKPMYIVDLSGPRAPNYCYLLMPQPLLDLYVPNATHICLVSVCEMYVGDNI